MELQHVDIFFQVIVFLFAISVHESAHAWMANRRGDPTAAMLGRISLNPIRHIDPFGTILLPAIGLLTGAPVIGWAKPVPVDPRNFKNVVRDDIATSVVGPISNFLVVAIALVLLLGLAFSPDGRGRNRCWCRSPCCCTTPSSLMCCWRCSTLSRCRRWMAAT
jgi:Zn-dependent protease